MVDLFRVVTHYFQEKPQRFSREKYSRENLRLSDFADSCLVSSSHSPTMIQMDSGDRLRVTLLDRMATSENSRSSVTLEDILMIDTSTSRPQPPPTPSLTVSASPARNRSLLDVMRRDRRRNKSTWKFLRDKLRLKRTATSWISSNPISNSETNRSNGDGGRLRLGTVLTEERDLSVQQTPRMSLMELLEDNYDGAMYEVSERREAEEEGETMTVTAKKAELGCCVCMIRSKGAAFIPCGHTFCRLCCRELWVQRGNCPLCNTSILQVLDIF
ncbi:unnamed protein product [Arabis nemorensis]|uniref:RING-type domain-containing protein n=1 Tax=Arabis nemorensis TaxID=586526 RepID=A0A565BJH0_9BRAS|nr:unnamed protein product [Arabis nemorensis]